MQKLWISAPSFLLPRGQSNNWRSLLLLQYVDWIHLVYPAQASQGTSWDIITGVYVMVPCCPMALWTPKPPGTFVIFSDFATLLVFTNIWRLRYTRNATDIWSRLAPCRAPAVLLLSFFVLLSFIKTKFDIDAMPSPSPTNWSKRSYPDCTWHFALKVSNKSLKRDVICILCFLYLSMRREKAVFTSTEPSVGPFVILYCGLLQIFIQSFR